jgi:hypothetical protein
MIVEIQEGSQGPFDQRARHLESSRVVVVHEVDSHSSLEGTEPGAWAQRALGYSARNRSYCILSNHWHFQSDEHLLTLLRFVERNPLSVRLVEKAELWLWGSLWSRARGRDAAMKALLSPWPVSRPANWTARVNIPLTAKELGRVRVSIERGRPYGDDERGQANGQGTEFGAHRRSGGSPPQGESIRHRIGGLVRAGLQPQNRVCSPTRFVGWRSNSLRPCFRPPVSVP